jgi:ATP-binding protein involved in chromosome partitioning
MASDGARLEAALGALVEPVTGLPLAELGMVRSVRSRRHRADVEIGVPIENWPASEELAALVRGTVESDPDVRESNVEILVMDEDERMALRAALRRHMEGDPVDDGDGHGGHGGHGHDGPSPLFLQPDSTTRVIGVSSGTGGVGKSSVTVNLAVSMARLGKSVAILDADVYGFSVPKMLGGDADPVILGDMVIPTTVHGVRCLSMGYFVPEDQPVIWRGPMLHKAIEQFLGDAYWGEPDFLFVDTPPGTGDVTLSLAQVMPRAEVIVVTTPQAAAQRVAQRAAFAARKLKLSVRGVVENMSWFTGDDGTRYELFGRGGGAKLAGDLGVPLLGQVPLVPALREGGDIGAPITVSDPDGEVAGAFHALAERLVALGPARVYRRELSLRS